MAKRVYAAVFLFTLFFLHVLSHTDHHHSPHNATKKNADIHDPKLNSDTQPLTSIDRQTRQNDYQNPSEDEATHSPSGSDQSHHAIQLEIRRSQSNESTNETSWHAHKHLGDIFNKTATLEEVAMGESEYFIEKIFRKYSERNVLLLAGLQHLMENVGLGEHSEEKETMEGETGQKVQEEKTGRVSLKRRSTSAVTHVHSDHSECYNVRELLSAFHFDRLNGLDLDHFLLLCPALIDQLDNSGCHHHHGNHQGHGRLSPDKGNNKDHAHAHEDESSDHHEHTHADTDDVLISEAATNKVVESGDIPPLVWVYSSVAVLVISLVGLLGVAVIPVMRRLFYKNLLQFLVALAVGALCGDALLHLLPHALSSGHGKHEKPAPRRDHAISYDHDDHKTISDSAHNLGTAEESGHDDTSVWKGLVALLGLLFFFLAERILIIVTSWRAEKRLQRKAQLGADLGGAKSLSEDRVLVLMVPATQNTNPSHNALIKETAILDDDDDDDSNGNENISDIFLSSKNNNNDHDAINRSSQSLHDDQGHSDEDQGHDEGHGHGHSHHHGDMPGSVSAVAWMVIMGDGIHNLSDGLAIGAAFASSVTGGFSTSVAVFCHELPHEIGDFAMLLKAGMPAKHALMYNVLSSVLCFIGMVIGVFLGQLENASSWIFCTVAGIFLYISLADMLPQLTVTRRKGGPSPCSQLLLQCVGVGVGAGIMLIIAVFEHDLKTLLD